MHIDHEYAEEYTSREKTHLILRYGMIFSLLVFISDQWFMPWFRQFVSILPCDELMGDHGVRWFWYGIFVGLPLLLGCIVLIPVYWRGYKILRDGQVPPIDHKVFRPTRIRRGIRARWIGYQHFLPFFLSLAVAGWGGVQAHKLVDFLPEETFDISACMVAYPVSTDESVSNLWICYPQSLREPPPRVGQVPETCG